MENEQDIIISNICRDTVFEGKGMLDGNTVF